MTELEKKDEILKLLTKALIIAIDDDVNLTLRGNRVYVDYGCSQFAIDIEGNSSQILPTSIHNKDKITSK